MRISTSGMHSSALSLMLQQQSTLSKTQNQIATGKRVNTPADDPIAAVHILELQRALKESEQFEANSNAATNRLTLEEQALADVGTLLHRVRELTLQGNTATVDPESRRLLAIEMRERLNELTNISNRRDANGEYLFSGYSTSTQPFVKSADAISYFGDQGTRSLLVGPNQRVADSHSGHDVFLAIPEGNGVFTTGASSTNTGTGVVAGGALVDRAAWEPADDYTVRFTSATGDYEILDSAGTQIATGLYTLDNAISFRGVNINMSGMPAMGDEFTVDRSGTEDLFSTLTNLVTALEAPTETHAQRAQFGSNMAGALQQLDQSSEHLLRVRAEVGTRLSSLENADAAREDQNVELERMTSELRDLDYAEAITRMNQQLVGLQAAQMSYSRISQLSLFNYLT